MTAQMVLDGDPDKVDVSGYTKGDILAADTTGTLTAVPVGPDADVLTADSVDTEGVAWATGGGGGSAPYVRKAYITTGNVTPPNTAGAWAALAGFELQIPAVVGDYVEIQAEFLCELKASTFYDYAVIVGATIVRYGATGTGTPGIEGFPGFYPDTAAFRGTPGPVGFTVTAPDLDGANVRWIIASASTSGTGTLFAGANFPFFWRAINYGVVL